MLARSHEHVAVKSWVFVQEGDGAVVFVDDVVCELWITREQLADKAARSDLLSDELEIDGAAFQARTPTNRSNLFAAEAGFARLRSPTRV